MLKSPRSQAYPPQLDLSTVRETIAYMEGDVRRVPGLERAAEALRTAMAEIEHAERKVRAITYSPIGARFLPRR